MSEQLDLFTPAPLPPFQRHSETYRDAVYAARAERFDGKEYPKPGHEPFNPTDREMGGAW